ncbi:MAG: ABC transporter ATP-binding protein [Proteobacteria bacterium]|nr:ABC transporter ATP-binding protein [Pseudomonadota bacterium]
MSEAGAIVLEAREVSKVYVSGTVRTRALDGVSLRVSSGERVALSGPSGSGKTTLLNLLGTLDRASSGRILLAGQDVGRLGEAELADLRLARLGFVFQAYNLVPVLTALENVELVLLLQGVRPAERRRRAELALDDLGLGELLHTRPGEMSGGQQQRVAVARAIVSEPEIVLADEPTANLDSKTAASLLDLMQQLNEERGVTFLFSTHDPRVMERALRVIRLLDGRIESDERRAP